MDDQNKNLILATVLSFLVILGWFVAGPMLFPQWFPEETAATTEVAATDATVPAAAETAPAAALFAAPRHPYTQSLLAAAPAIDPRHRRTQPPLRLASDEEALAAVLAGRNVVGYVDADVLDPRAKVLFRLEP